MRLSEIKWEGPETLDEVIIWGVEPLKELDRILDERIEDLEDDKRLLYVHYMIRNGLEELEDALNRLAGEIQAQSRYVFSL